MDNRVAEPHLQAGSGCCSRPMPPRESNATLPAQLACLAGQQVSQRTGAIRQVRVHAGPHIQQQHNLLALRGAASEKANEGDRRVSGGGGGGDAAAAAGPRVHCGVKYVQTDAVILKIQHLQRHQGLPFGA